MAYFLRETNHLSCLNPKFQLSATKICIERFEFIMVWYSGSARILSSWIPQSYSKFGTTISCFFPLKNEEILVPSFKIDGFPGTHANGATEIRKR